MNCAKCNFPHPPCEIKGGICFECTHKELERLKVELEHAKPAKLTCFCCSDGNTPLYCLNCAGEVLAPQC